MIERALDYLIFCSTRIFIWATTVANFLKLNPDRWFVMLEKGDRKGLKSLYSLYSTILKALFRHGLEEEEIKIVISVIGAMILAKQLLDDNALIILPKVKILGSDVDNLGFIRKCLMSIIDSGPIFCFHYWSFEV